MESALAYLIIIVLGLLVGSYLNSWMWRVRHHEWTFGGRSKCVHCGRELAWYENIPLISFIALQGKCRTCNGVIPVDYFLVELVTPLLLVGVTYYHLNFVSLHSWHYFRDIFFTILLISVFVYDFKYMEIRSGVVYGGTIVALITNFLILQSSNLQSVYSSQFIANSVIAMAVGGGLFLLQYIISKGKWIGGGDVRLGVMMGALLGWPNILVALFLAYVFGTVVAVPLLIFKKKNMKAEVPFGTFLAVGTFVTLLWGPIMVEWYQHLIRW